MASLEIIDPIGRNLALQARQVPLESQEIKKREVRAIKDRGKIIGIRIADYYQIGRTPLTREFTLEELEKIAYTYP